MEAEIQLERSVKIGYIDVGNCGSGSIEILVGRSMTGSDTNFVPFLPMTQLMSVPDIKTGQNRFSVKMFNKDFFQRSQEEHWDRIKIVCLQKTKPMVKFGLCFIRIHSQEDKDGCTSSLPTAATSQNVEKDSAKPTSDGLMDFIRGLHKHSPKQQTDPSLSRSASMVQRALQIKTSAQNHPSPETPNRKRVNDLQKFKKNKIARTVSGKWSMAGEFTEEVQCFLEGVNFKELDLETVTYADLRAKMEKQRGSPLTKAERKLFINMINNMLQGEAESEEKSNEEDIEEMTVCKNCLMRLPKFDLRFHKRSCPMTNILSEPKNGEVQMPFSGGKSVLLEGSSGTPGLEKQKTENINTYTGNSMTNTPLPSNSGEVYSWKSHVRSGSGGKDTAEKEISSETHKRKRRKNVKNKTSPVSPNAPLSQSLDKDKMPNHKISTLCDDEPRNDSLQSSSNEESQSSARSPEMVECPICESFFSGDVISMHSATCFQFSASATADPRVPCPICREEFPQSRIALHADVCASVSFDVSNLDNRESILSH